VFWNFWTSFMGWPLIKLGPAKFFFYPVVVGVPLVAVIYGQSGKPSLLV